MMRENGRKKRAARRFSKYTQLRRQASLNQMTSDFNESIDALIIALEMRFPKYSEAYARI